MGKDAQRDAQPELELGLCQAAQPQCDDGASRASHVRVAVVPRTPAGWLLHARAPLPFDCNYYVPVLRVCRSIGRSLNGLRIGRHWFGPDKAQRDAFVPAESPNVGGHPGILATSHRHQKPPALNPARYSFVMYQPASPANPCSISSHGYARHKNNMHAFRPAQTAGGVHCRTHTHTHAALNLCAHTLQPPPSVCSMRACGGWQSGGDGVRLPSGMFMYTCICVQT